MIAICLLLALTSSLFPVLTRATLAEFYSLDVSSPSFSVDFGESESSRWSRLAQLGSVPLKGWNSYDGWDWSVSEADMVANIDYMAANLAQYGYRIATVDYYWFMDLNSRTIYLDEFGRLQPDPNRFPSSMGNLGFKKLAAYAHSKGLFFGIHTMRGINIVATNQKLKVRGSNITIDQITDYSNPCPWNNGGAQQAATFYSINLTHAGGQLFSDSLYAQYGEWGVDFIKNDCVYGDFVGDQILSVSTAIDRSGRKMFYSLSPGTDDPNLAEKVSPYVSMYRITGDTWDRWDNIKTHFGSAQRLQSFIARPNGRYGLPSWPDLDMLPLGFIGNEGQNISPLRLSNLTRDEQVTLMSLWTIFRSPLIYGGTFQRPDNFSLSLLTNEEALYVTDHSRNNTCLANNQTFSMWAAKSVNSSVDGFYFFTLHNLDSMANSYTISLSVVTNFPASTKCSVRDLWNRVNVAHGVTEITVKLNSHASGLWKVFDCSNNESASEAKLARRAAKF